MLRSFAMMLLLLVMSVAGKLEVKPLSRNPMTRTPRRVAAKSARGGGAMSEDAAVVSLVKTIIGAGIMALPSGMAAGKGTGVVPAVIIVALHAMISAYTYTLVGRAVEASGAVDFNDLWRKAFGKRSSWLIDAMVGGVASGVVLTYGCFLGDLISSLIPGISRTAAIVGLALFPLLPLALARDLSALKHSSMIGVAAILLSVFVVVKRALDGTYASGSFKGDQVMSSSRLSLGTCVLFNMLSTAFMAHTNAVRAYRELADRSRQNSVALKAWSLSALLYGAVMLAGYCTFGNAAKGLVLSNYNNDDTLALATKYATVVSLLGSHPLVFTSLRDSASSLFNIKQSFVPLSVGLLTLFTALALVVPDAGFVVSITGASVGSALICVVPCLIYLNIVPLPLNPSQKDLLERSLLKILIGFGFGVAAFGTVVTCLETFTDLLH